MEETMTIEQALKEGYEFCGKQHEEWQSLTDINDLNEEDLREGYYAAQKKPNYFTFSKESIAETLAELIDENYSQENGRDDDEVYQAIKKLDFSQMETMINSALEKFPYWYLTKIKLTPPNKTIEV